MADASRPSHEQAIEISMIACSREGRSQDVTCVTNIISGNDFLKDGGPEWEPFINESPFLVHPVPFPCQSALLSAHLFAIQCSRKSASFAARPSSTTGQCLFSPASFLLPDSLSRSAYCSDECQNSDLVSPSASSSSSALSSPSLGFTHGAEVPALAPSALGSALRSVQKRDPYYASASSWNLTPEDDDDTYSAFGISKADTMYEGNPKGPNYISALRYTRRPSIVNHHSTIPQVHQRGASGDQSVLVSGRRHRGCPRSVPSSSATDEEDFSDSSSPSKVSSARRNGDRGSLPAYFNLLRIRSPSKTSLKSSPVLSSSTNTVAHLSPPTPKIVVSTQSNIPESDEPPRGRRRNADHSSCSRRSDNSSPSRSRSRPLRVAVPARDEPEWDLDPPRGRAGRRNSSPPARAIMGVENPIRALSARRDIERSDRSCSSARPGRSRGRVPVEELDSFVPLEMAPGYGNGRSGLVDRQRWANMNRIPL